MSAISPFAQSPFSVYTSLGPSATPGGFSGNSFGAPGLPQGFGFPSFGDPLFYFTPAASSFMINRLLGFANNSAVNINVGPTPSSLGFGRLLLGGTFFSDSGLPGTSPYGGSNPFGGGFPGFSSGFSGGGGGFPSFGGGGSGFGGGGFGGGFPSFGGGW